VKVIGSAICVRTQLAASVALHGLRLAVTGEVVWPTAFVAGGRASTTSEAAPEAASAPVSAARRAASSTTHSWVRAIASEMTSEPTAVATSARASSAQAQSRAVGLDVPKALAVVALLSCPVVSCCAGCNSYLQLRLAI
jgi:hypothetical protein